ncbi:hypothetical protein CC1G_03460 [Coprinopsis cinerea okayama7|uniref:SP-RING-type domain-containing protein n=1 Tax=Coprinopsis cinerea (strain Okayama-7 / 130 / ATCC MYA-4618 / FGSC 9003) TaxID=240176 RepID=A8NQT6_COPC7|nr:hypothetical protein CC1G_03460 [Coprinopsis cinerea okayama7\|eukprot:XP_001835678.2 hypothetical protein CC1G_03460 [Coprinopsis cinerea okayama7\
MIQDIASALADNVDEEAAREPIESLDSVMRELIDLSTEMISHKEVIDDIRQKLVQGQKIDNALDRYMSGVEAKKEEYQKKTTRQKYAKSDAYIEFRSSIWNAQKPGQPMPPLTTFIEKEDGDDSDDDDLEIGGQTQDFKCPITLTILIDPLTSRLCGHSYDAAAIRSMLGRGSKACPAAGCKKMIAISDCLPNEDLAKKAKNHKRRLERQEEEAHSDVDEVIE